MCVDARWSSRRLNRRSACQRSSRTSGGSGRRILSSPPGETGFNPLRTHRLQRDSLRVLLDYYERYGPLFTLRVFHRLVVFMLGPEANHFVTVSGAEHFSWRRGMFGEQLIPLLGDGLITTDGDYHDRARRIMMPAFHARRMEAAVAVMTEEAARGLERWRPGRTLDVYAWMRDVAIRIAMRALLGFHPDGRAGHKAAKLFERALSFYDTETWMMLLRGPGSPWARFQPSSAPRRSSISASLSKAISHTLPGRLRGQPTSPCRSAGARRVCACAL